MRCYSPPLKLISNKHYINDSLDYKHTKDANFIHSTNSSDHYNLDQTWGSQTQSYSHEWANFDTLTGGTSGNSSHSSSTSYEHEASGASGSSSDGFAIEAYFRDYNPDDYVQIQPTAAPSTSQSHGQNTPPSSWSEPSPYSNILMEWIGEYFVRPNYGDEFLINGSDEALIGTTVGVATVMGVSLYFGGAQIFTGNSIAAGMLNGVAFSSAGVLNIGSNGTAPPMTIQGLATNAAFGMLFGGLGSYFSRITGVADDVAGSLVQKNAKAAFYTERELLSAAPHLKIPNVKVNYVDDLLQTEGAYGLYRDGQIFVQKGLSPEITKGIIRHEYAHMVYDNFSSTLANLYFKSGLLKVGEEAIVHAFGVGSIRKGLVFSTRYIDILFFRDLGLAAGAGSFIAYRLWINE